MGRTRSSTALGGGAGLELSGELERSPALDEAAQHLRKPLLQLGVETRRVTIFEEAQRAVEQGGTNRNQRNLSLKTAPELVEGVGVVQQLEDSASRLVVSVHAHECSRTSRRRLRGILSA